MSEFKAKLMRGTEDQANPLIWLSYLAGLGFLIASIFKFKQWKENPQQITLATAVVLLIAGLGSILSGIKQRADNPEPSAE